MSHQEGTNGAQGPSHVLRVFRLKPGERCTVRTLSETYAGLFTHFVRGRSVYCDPTNCNPANHRTGRFWKGYAAAEIWNKPDGVYVPIVLEITEALELDMRGRWRRGQLWELSREKQVGKRHPPIVGVLVGDAPGPLRPAFDCLDVLTHLYHAENIQLGELNPMPARVLVRASVGAPPPVVPKNGTHTPDPEQAAQAARFWQEKRGQMAEFLKDGKNRN